MGVIFRSPASIELSPISTASQIGIELNNNLLSSPYKPTYKPNIANIASPPQSVYYDRHIQHNMTQSITDVTFHQQQSVNIATDNIDIDNINKVIDDNKSSPDLILPSDNSDVDTDDEEIEHMLPGINNSKSNRSKSYKQYMSTHQKKKLRNRNSINDSGSET
eukprot:959699_1